MIGCKAVLAAVVVAVVAAVVKTVSDAGEFTARRPHGLEDCRLVRHREIVGAEDACVVPGGSGLAYLSVHDRADMVHHDGEVFADDPVGSIMEYDFATGEVRVVPLVGLGDTQLRPHGIDCRGETLAVVNHEPGFRESVLIFRRDGDGDGGGSLRLVRRFADAERMTGLNDVALADDDGDEVYASNWKHSKPGTLAMLWETYAQMPWTDVVRCRAGAPGGRCEVAAAGFRMANGVLVTPDGTRVWVAESIGRQVVEFSRDPATGALSRLREIGTDSFNDNLSWNGADGSLLVTSHPRALSFVIYSKRPHARGGSHSPWHVLRLASGASEFDELVYSLGDHMSAASVAVRHGDKMLVGSVMDRGVMLCENVAE